MVITATNVTFRNVRIAADCFYLFDNGTVRDGRHAYDVGTTTFDHVTLICTGHGGTAIGEARITAIAVDISLCENGFDIDTTLTLTDSYVHDLLLDGSAHTDGVQVCCHGANVVLHHNTMLVQGDTSALIVDGGNPGLAITDNLLDGGAYTIYCMGNTGQLTGNRFGNLGPNHTAPWEHADQCQNMTRSGNVLDADNSPLSGLT